MEPSQNLTDSSFNVHGILYIGGEEQTAPVEQEIRNLASGLQMVKDEQAYLVVRERVHRNTCESTVRWILDRCADSRTRVSSGGLSCRSSFSSRSAGGTFITSRVGSKSSGYCRPPHM